MGGRTARGSTRTGIATLALAGCWLASSIASGQSPRPSIFREPSSEIAPLRGRLLDLRAEGRLSDASALGVERILELAEHGPVRRGEPTPWLDRARRYLELAEAGRDPYLEARGEITQRAYRSPVSQIPQGYAIYVPPDYDPARAYPLLVALHGGSTNANLFLALVLGGRVQMSEYRDHWETLFEPSSTPEWIVVAPNGFGNSMWRFLGERDVLDVLADVSQHYRVDADRVVLSGLSNGGLGSFNVGVRHAWRFAAIVPLAGSPGWVQYLGAHPDETEARILEPLSAWSLIANARNTHLHAHHGTRDPGRMEPRHLHALSEHLDVLEVPFTLDWYVTGHELVGPVHRQGQLFGREAERRRDPRPPEIHLVTGDYRAARMHWVTVTRIEGYPALAQVDASVEGASLALRTERVSALVIDLSTAPLPAGSITLSIDGQERRIGGARGLLHLVREASGWRVGAPRDEGRRKRPGLSGPIPDATYDRLVHVYGTLRPDHTATLREAAERGSHGWLGNLHDVRQRVIADTALDDATMARSHVVLYGSPADNAVLARLADRLPIRVEPGAVVIADARYAGRHVGTRFVFPNPLCEDRYVIVQGSHDPRVVLAADNLPAFLPDWVVFDERRLPSQRANLPPAGAGYLASGFFDDRWRVTR